MLVHTCVWLAGAREGDQAEIADDRQSTPREGEREGESTQSQQCESCVRRRRRALPLAQLDPPPVSKRGAGLSERRGVSAVSLSGSQGGV